MREGWIKVSREISNHWISQDKEKLGWWIDLLLMANWEDKKVLHDSHLFTLKRGQMMVSLTYLMKKWGKSKHTIINFLKLLQQDGMIERSVLHRQTPILTICNYDKYQDRGDTIVHPQMHPQVHPIVHPNKEYKEYKNKEKDNNKLLSKKKFQIPSLEEVRAYCVERGNSVDAEQFCDFYESKDWYVGKNRMKDWKACVRTWEKRHPIETSITIKPNNNGDNNISSVSDGREQRAREVAEAMRRLMQG